MAYTSSDIYSAPAPTTSSQMPDWMGSVDDATSGLQSNYNRVGHDYQMRDLSLQYKNTRLGNLASGAASAAAAGRAYTNRAMLSGASTLGGGYAQASAMLPIYQQNNALMSDLASKKLTARGNAANMRAQLQTAIATAAQNQRGLMNTYSNQQQGYAENALTRAQAQGQYDAENTIATGSLANQVQATTNNATKNANDFTLGTEQNKISATNAAANSESSRVQALIAAYNATKSKMYSYNTYTDNTPRTSKDVESENAFKDNQNIQNSVLGSLYSMGS